MARDQDAENERVEDTVVRGKAKITMDVAQAVALGQFPGGTVQELALENENGNVVATPVWDTKTIGD